MKDRLEPRAEDHGNLLAPLPAPGAAEAITVLVAAPGFRVERIVSHGHRSPDGFWYDQPEHEWVTVVTGGAILAF